MKHLFGWSIPLALAAACSVSPPDSTSSSLSSSPSPVTVPWGEGGMTLQPAIRERLALGPSAVSVDRDGAALVLDNWGQRLWRIPPSKNALAVPLPVRLPRDTEDVIGWPDGTLAVYRPVSRSVDLFDREGATRGHLQIPRAVVDIGLLEAGPSHRVLVTDPFQEVVTLGSPAAPLDESSVLRSRRDGVAGGLEVIVHDGRALLRVLEAGDRKRVRRELLVGDGVTAASIVGRSGSVACLRLERQLGTATVRVARDAVCVDVESGRERLRVALPAPGLYVPRRELALGGAPLQLVHIEPSTAGLVVRRWEVAR